MLAKMNYFRFKNECAGNCCCMCCRMIVISAEEYQFGLNTSSE